MNTVVLARRAARAAALGVPLLLAGLAPAAGSAAAPGYGHRTLHQGMHGPDVRALQTYLTRAGQRTGGDGTFGTATTRSVKRFERAHGMRVDGRVPPADARAIRRAATSGSSRPAKPRIAPDTASAGGGGAPGDGTTPTGDPGSPSLGAPTGRATLNDDGTATAPADAPPEIQDVIAAGNRIASKPYVYGGGHGSFRSRGYDCSGSVSYALHGGGLLDQPMDSSGLMSFGSSGKGRWITIYSNPGHVYMVVAGLRFDTSGARASGSRWQQAKHGTGGYTVRHPKGF